MTKDPDLRRVPRSRENLVAVVVVGLSLLVVAMGMLSLDAYPVLVIGLAVAGVVLTGVGFVGLVSREESAGDDAGS